VVSALNLRKDELRGAIDSADTFRLLVDAVTDYAIYMLDPEGQVVSWSTGAQRIKGYAAEEIIGRHFSRFYTPEDVEADLPRQVLQIAARDGKFEAEGWRLRKDGARFWAHVVVHPIKGPSGRLLGFAKITRDLSERKQAERALRETQEEFRLLVQSVTDYALYMIDREGNVASWNSGAERIKGYRPEEVIGRHFSTFYTEEDRAAGAPARTLAIARQEGRYENEGWRVRKDGTRFWAHVVIDPIHESDGTLRGFAKITRDITERRDTQRKLDEAREALFQSQKMDAIGQLTGGIAHDFNNLLTAIIGSLELVRKRIGEDPRTTPLVANALQAAQRGATLTQRMLAFARRQELQAEPTDIRGLIAGMADLLDRSLGSAIKIVIRFTPSIGRVMIDRNQLEMALLNLAVNARDAMPAGGELALEAREATLGPANSLGLQPGRYAVLSVIDQGEGMDEATLRRATEPFYTTKGVGKGTGLGLSMVHGLAEQLGGGLQLQSTPGKGTTASLWLPVMQQAVDAEPESPPEPEPPHLPPLAILAVDDDALVLINTAAMLEDRGHRVTMAYSAAEALELLAGGTFDLLITDQGMPGMTGAELIEQIRKSHPGLPIVLATGYAELPAGAALDVPRLAKPFRQEQLLEAVARAVTDAS
jgi:PAS domain S-box-containing protein